MSAVDPLALRTALAEWSAIVGREHVCREGDALRLSSTATFATSTSALAIVRPANRTEVQESVRVANRHGVPLYPISSGKNWGYGSSAPVRDGVLLDLGRMNRIVDFDEQLAYVTIEPGVTQQQLFDFLRARSSGLWMDATGASPECSIIGNTMERGFGHTPMGDHCGNSCGYEVVLPSGECVETGFGRFPGSKAAALSRWGVGPSLDGLFAQSNLGIVTRMTVWLMPKPEHFEAFFFFCQQSDGLAAIVEALRPLRLNGTLRSTIHIGNDYKVLTATTQFPWSEPGVRAPLDAEAMSRLRAKMSFGVWNGSGGLYGTKAQVKDAKRQIRKALAGKVDRLRFVDDRLLSLLGRFAGPFRLLTGWDVSHTLRVMAPVYNLMKGVPTAAPLSSAYWRKKSAPPSRMDPDRDRCGLLWCSPVMPLSGSDVREVTDLTSRIVMAHGFEPQMSLSLTTERSATCVATISYDRDVPGEDQRALECYDVLTKELLARGYPPYRLNVRSMHHAHGAAGYDALLGRLKDALDPRHVLAPGRYDGISTRTRAADDLVAVAR